MQTSSKEMGFSLVQCLDSPSHGPLIGIPAAPNHDITRKPRLIWQVCNYVSLWTHIPSGKVIGDTFMSPGCKLAPWVSLLFTSSQSRGGVAVGAFASRPPSRDMSSLPVFSPTGEAGGHGVVDQKLKKMGVEKARTARTGQCDHRLGGIRQADRCQLTA